MPTKKAITRNPRKKRIVDHVARLLCPRLPLIEPAPDTQLRIVELATPTPTELECSICSGVGLPKIDGTDMHICVVCRAALKDVPRTERKALIADHERFLLHRLPYFLDWFLSPDRMAVVTDTRKSA
jgi:hypothetical protein